jgi:hypothetical protein
MIDACSTIGYFRFAYTAEAKVIALVLAELTGRAIVLRLAFFLLDYFLVRVINTRIVLSVKIIVSK